ncbi:MAG: ATP-dependent zinc metalloprotease FtsH [Myxococcales bacterium]|nr:ATP-dependent zinc metalloprotease FtsH [Myxococcales bacterium]
MNPWLLLIVVVIFLWLYFSSRKGGSTQRGVLSFGKSRAREVADETATFADVAGVDEAVDELKEIVDFLRQPERYASIGARIPKGVLLVGPPGTGKTLLARAVAGEASVPFYQMSGSDFVEMFVGVGASRVRDLFEKARQSAPCIVFIDELDALGRARGSGAMAHEEREQTLNQLLVEMDGFDASTGVIIMAATNRPEILDGALLRAGRFDRQVSVDPPERDGRRAILDIHTRDVQMDPDVDLDRIAARTPGFAGADLANLVNEAALLAARRNKPKVGKEELDEAIERATLGLEKKGRLRTEEEKRFVAYHELGHAVVAEVLPGAHPVEKVTIIPRGMSLGTTWHMPQNDGHLAKRSQLTDIIASILGGRAAEMVFIGEPLAGAHSDLSKATELASDMVRKYGMSELGIRTFEPARKAVLGDFGASPADHGAATADQIDQAVDGIVKEGLQRAIKVLEEHRDAVEKLTDELLAKDSLDGHVIREMLGLPPRENTEGLTIGPGDAPESAKATSSDAATKSDAAATAADASADAPGDEPATA